MWQVAGSVIEGGEMLYQVYRWEGNELEVVFEGDEESAELAMNGLNDGTLTVSDLKMVQRLTERSLKGE